MYERLRKRSGIVTARLSGAARIHQEAMTADARGRDAEHARDNLLIIKRCAIATQTLYMFTTKDSSIQHNK